jgi:hypothetical protein
MKKPASSSGAAPMAARNPAPPSFVADPPSPTTTVRAPASTAVSTSAPSPNVVVRFGSRSSSPSKCRPQAWALSTYAVAPSTSTRPLTGRPSGSIVGTSMVAASGSAAASTSTKPGPPSDSGRRTRSSPGATERQPAANASATSTAGSVPANLSGQISTRTRTF